MDMVTLSKPKPLFDLGRTLATPGALAALEEAGQLPAELILRHSRGDWGDLVDDDKRANDDALRNGSRILSAYMLGTGTKIWIITEAADDKGRRSATTCLLPDESEPFRLRRLISCRGDTTPKLIPTTWGHVFWSSPRPRPEQPAVVRRELKSASPPDTLVPSNSTNWEGRSGKGDWTNGEQRVRSRDRVLGGYRVGYGH